MLKWLRENGCPWDTETCNEAAMAGHREMLQWAVDNGCPWDEEACASAARGGNLEVLQWLRESGCPWNDRTCELAAQGGHIEVLQVRHAPHTLPPHSPPTHSLSLSLCCLLRLEELPNDQKECDRSYKMTGNCFG